MGLIDETSLTEFEKYLLSNIEHQRKECNVDNISRTEAYFNFFKNHPEIKWSFLAHMVSRNAGWNMCDLEGKWFPKVMGDEQRCILYSTYERANWLIFQDAYPQLLLYHYSTKMGASMFHLLKFFHVSEYMEREWEVFWALGDKSRLLIALIINEQNVIHKPVIQHPRYKRKVFHSFIFTFQDWLHYSCVLFPTIEGELYGASVNGFNSVDKRINLGKRLSSTLFDENLYPQFFQFAELTKHTGSRQDYEQYISTNLGVTTPSLRLTFPIIHHHIHQYEDWSQVRKIKASWVSPTVTHRHPVRLTTWFQKKQRRLHKSIEIKERISSFNRKKRVSGNEN